MRSLGALIALLIVAVTTPVAAQDKYPSKQITIIVGFPPGGVIDLAARALAPAMQKVSGQPVIVVTKAGAAGAVGTQAAAIAAPDGYTLTVGTNQIALLPAVDKIFERAPAFSRSDFVPVARLTAEPMFIVSTAEQKWTRFQDMIADAKAREGQIVYASGGLYGNSHIPVELMQKATGTRFRHLPTAGGGPLLNAVLGNNAAFGFLGPAAVLPHVQAGKMRALAQMGTARHPAYPDTPTLKELGIDLEYYNWSGLFAPSKTPSDVLAALQELVSKAVEQPEFKEPLVKAGSAPDVLLGSAFASWFKTNSEANEAAVQLVGKVQ